MAKPFSKAESQRADLKGEGLVLLPNCVTRSDQWKAMGFRAREVVRAIASHFTGYNNSEISVSARQLAGDLGNNNTVGNDQALQEAILAGFVERMRVYPKGARRGSEFRLTWVNTGKRPHFKPATHDYLVGSVVVKQKRAQPRNSISTTETREARRSGQVLEHRASTVGTGEAENPRLTVSVMDTHLFITTPPTASDRLDYAGNSGRPRSVTEDAWILAQRRAAANPATCDEGHVRAAVQRHLELTPRGEQSHLCREAGLPVATLSRFLSGGALADDRLCRLMTTLLQRENIAA